MPTTYKLLIVCDKNNLVDIDPALLGPNELEGFGRIEGLEVRTAGGEQVEIRFHQEGEEVKKIDGVPVNTMDMFSFSQPAVSGKPVGPRDLYKMRMASGLTCQEWTEKLGFKSKCAVYCLERGTDFLPTIQKVNSALGVNYSQTPRNLERVQDPRVKEVTPSDMMKMRKDSGLPQEKWAEKLNVRPASVRRLERDLPVKSSTVRTIEEALNIKLRVKVSNGGRGRAPK